MPNEFDRPRNIAVVAVAFEGGLAVLALGVGWLVGYYPLQTVRLAAGALPGHGVAVLWGLAATLPMLLVPLLIQQYPFGPLGRLQRTVEQLVVPLFARATIFQLALVSLVAGIGEEVLFRGLIQAGLADVKGLLHAKWIALATTSVLFGLVHWITRTYVLLATLIGLYLGLLFMATENLLAPIVAHGLYDFLVLVYLIKWRRPAAGDRE